MAAEEVAAEVVAAEEVAVVSIVVHRAVPTLVESSTAHTHTVPRPPASLGSAPRSRPVHRPLSQNPDPPCTAQTPTFWGRNRVAVEVGSRTLAAAAVPLAGCRRSALRARPLGWRARPPTPSFTRGTAPCSCPCPRPHRGPGGSASRTLPLERLGGAAGGKAWRPL